MFSPPLIQDMTNVWVTLFNVFWFWGLKNTGPNPDHPFYSNPQAGALSTVGALLRTSNFYFSEARIVGGGRGAPKIKEGVTLRRLDYGSLPEP